MPKPALGRGLGVLLGASASPKETPAPGNSTVAPPAHSILKAPLDQIQPGVFQPRKIFSDESLTELADSIREQGILQPLVVRARHGRFELIAGERRWRAAKLAGLAEAPVVVREVDDRTALELALVENLQRENLNPLEEALGYGQLIDQFNLKQEEAAARVGKSRAAVANALRLLKLPAEVQSYVRDGRLSVGHAKVILGLSNAGDQSVGAQEVIRDGLNVRQTEDLVANWRSARVAAPRNAKTPSAKGSSDPHLDSLKTRIEQRFGAKVRIKYRGGKGAVQISFFNEDDFERVLGLLGVEAL